MADQSFWKSKKLAEMTTDEWESICDGCAKCCMVKLQDEDTEEVFYTKVVCQLLDQQSCSCTDYQHRHEKVPTCLWLKPEHLDELEWLPVTCAYRLLHEGQPLPQWHHLVSGSRDSIHESGVSVKGRVISEEFVHPDGLEEHIIHWVE